MKQRKMKKQWQRQQANLVKNISIAACKSNMA